MVLKVARRGAVPPFIVMDVMNAAAAAEAAGQDVMHMEVGQPSTAAPEAALEAARAALQRDKIGYTVAFGIPELRQRLSRYYADYYGAEVPTERIAVTTGSSGGFLLAFLSSFEAGGKVALTSPGYPAYRNILQALDVEAVNIPTGPETNFQPTVEILEAVEQDLDGLIIASPSNPTGTMIPGDELKRLCDYCGERGIRLISDEIYHGITYAERAETVLAHTDDAVVINSFSKYFSMTGWRLGWMVLPEDLLRSVECLAQNFFISPPTLSQHAGAAVFDCVDELDVNFARYAANRELLLRELPEAGFDKLSHADGAFYIYADVGHMTNDSNAFCKKMLAETGVATTPGIDFDPDRGHRYLRFSFAGSTDEMAEAVRRLKAWRGA